MIAAAERARQYRRRQREGVRVITIEIDETALVAWGQERGYLSPLAEPSDDQLRMLIARALETVTV